MLGSPEIKWPKLLLLAALFIIFYLAQAWFQLRVGWSFDFVLVLLITSAFFLSLLEIFFVSALVVLISTWQPGVSWEMLLLFALPLLTYGARKVFSWESWISNIIFSLSGILIFYSITSSGTMGTNWLLFANNLLGSAIFAVISFFLLEYIYGSE